MTKLTMAGLTDPGRLRPENEDCIVLYPEIGLAVLADGMGGHNAGEVASRMAVDVMTRYCVDAFASEPPAPTPTPTEPCDSEAGTLRGAIEAANTAIHEMARHNPEYAGMSATVVVAPVPRATTSASGMRATPGSTACAPAGWNCSPRTIRWSRNCSTAG